MADIATVIHLLDEARGFAALSPAGRENISEAIDILEALNTRPAAPVEGLDPIGYVHRGTVGLLMEGAVSKAVIVPKSGGDFKHPVVFADQAEAIIAAKDERLKDCRSVINEFKREIKKHEADNAALAARVKELEGELAQYKDQKPVGYTTEHLLRCLERGYSGSLIASPGKFENLNVPIYAAPAPCSSLETQLAAARKVLEKLTLHSNSLALAHVHKTQKNDGIWGALKEARATLEAKP